MTTWTRRKMFAGAFGLALVGAMGPAWALSTGDAKAHVQKTLDELKALLRIQGAAEARAPRLRQIMESRASMPGIAKFAAGRDLWKAMNKDQQGRYRDAFSHFVSITYARRFDEYSGNPIIDVTAARDLGRKGVLVESPIRLTSNDTPVEVSWLVSDRSGKIEINDMVIEGVSMAITLRDELSAMYAKRGKDVERLIKDLRGAK